MKHIPALDGLRAVAVAMVVLFHTVGLPGGYLGVDIFFVLSGFLITTLLIDEHRETGTIRIANFYIRRAFRLMPCLWLMVAAVFVFALLTDLAALFHTNRTTSLAALLYVENWLLIAFPRLGGNIFQHTWSLAIEEQFYLIWAPVLYLLLRRLGPNRLAGFLSAALILSIAWRAALWISGASFLRVLLGSDTRSDELIAGALLAALYAAGRLDPLRQFISGLSVAGAAAIVFAAALSVQGTSAAIVLWEPVCMFSSVAIIARIVLEGSVHGLFACLAWSPLLYIGSISYGIYLWHDPLNWALSASAYAESSLARLLVAGGGGLCLAVISFELVEKRVRVAGKRWFRPAAALAPRQS